jgi:hypothetical protein
LSILTTLSVLRRKASMGHAKASISMLAGNTARSIGMVIGAFQKIEVVSRT